jgi:hypothetical protein
MTRKTFPIPPGHEAVRDSEGRATGEVRPCSAATEFTYRKKPVSIEAWRLGSEQPRPAWAKWDFGNGHDYAVVCTLEGEMRGERGDWLIRGVKGELYFCKPDIFALTYERPDGVAQGAVSPGVIERMVTDAWDQARAEAIEECARVCDKHARWAEDKIAEPPESPTSQTFAATSLAANDCAEMIRAIAAQPPAAPVETEEKLVSELADVAEAHFLPTVKAMREALLAAREAIWSGGDTIRAITAIDAALACPSNARTAPESCQNCINEDDCASVDICRAVEEVTTPQPSSAVTEGAEEAIRDWWYSDRRQPMTSKEAAKSLIWYLAKCGFKIVREPQAGEWINEPLRNWTASTNEPQTVLTRKQLADVLDSPTVFAIADTIRNPKSGKSLSELWADILWPRLALSRPEHRAPSASSPAVAAPSQRPRE